MADKKQLTPAEQAAKDKKAKELQAKRIADAKKRKDELDKLPPEERKKKISAEKQGRFVELGSMRTRNILKQLRILGNCSSNNYEYTQEQLDKIFGAIEKAVNDTKALFSPKDEKDKAQDFSL